MCGDSDPGSEPQTVRVGFGFRLGIFEFARHGRVELVRLPQVKLKSRPVIGA